MIKDFIIPSYSDDYAEEVVTQLKAFRDQKKYACDMTEMAFVNLFHADWDWSAHLNTQRIAAMNLIELVTRSEVASLEKHGVEDYVKMLVGYVDFLEAIDWEPIEVAMDIHVIEYNGSGDEQTTRQTRYLKEKYLKKAAMRAFEKEYDQKVAS